MSDVQTARPQLLACTTALACAIAFAGAAHGQGNGNGNGNGNGGGNGGGGGANGSPEISQRIDCRFTAPDPTSLPLPLHQLHQPGSIQHDGNPVYADGEPGLLVEAGDRRALRMAFGKNAARYVKLDLGTELPSMAGDGNGAVTVDGPPLNFFGLTGVPRPDWGPDGTQGTVDDGVTSTETFALSSLKNVAALGAFPMSEYTPYYCQTDLSLFNPSVSLLDPETEVDPNDPSTFSQMATNLRWRFSVGQHRWAIYVGLTDLGPPLFPTHPDAGPVVIERIFDPANPTPDPYATNPPWRIRVLPWQTTDPGHPRYGLTVAFLVYRGTKKNDPEVYVGAFDVRWADHPGSMWTGNPL